MKIDNKYKWLARDLDGFLYAYVDKPEKLHGFWDAGDGDSELIRESYSTYSFIKWEDKEPFSIDKLAITAKDNVNKPTHYHSGNIDVIKFSEENFSKEEQKGFHRINAIKYITRYDRKNGVEDLNKAKFYIDKLIEMEESE